ncbi:MAG TPA: EamA family transporter [Caulobacteraceae bacterium]
MQPSSRLTLTEAAALLAVVLIWGVNNAAAKVATEVLPPLLTGAVRFGIAAAVLAWFVRPPFPNWRQLAFIAVVGGPVHYGFIYLAFWLADDLSPVSVATQLWIPLTALFAFLMLGERLKVSAVVGMAIAFAGVVWMSLDPHAAADWPAILAAIVGGAAWAMVTVVTRRTAGISPLKMQGLLALVAAPSLLAGSLLFERGQLEALWRATPLVWDSLAWAGLASSVVATSLTFWLVQRREAGRVTPYLLATPLVSIAIGWGFLGDQLSAQILVGAALTMVGVAAVAVAERGLRAGSQTRA